MGLFAGTLLLASFISYLTLKDIVIVNNELQLEKSINLLAMQLETTEDYDAFAAAVKARSEFRLTLINADGTVIAESDFDRHEMENHAAREEIIMSRSENYGMAIRYSHTLKTDFLYVAKQLKMHDNVFYMRLSLSLEEAFRSFNILWSRMTLV